MNAEQYDSPVQSEVMQTKKESLLEENPWIYQPDLAPVMLSKDLEVFFAGEK